MELKVKKINSVEDFNVDKTELGKNLFKIIFKGNVDFEKLILIQINYDKSKIPIGKTSSNSVVAYINIGGQWTRADFNIDEQNSKLTINLTKFTSKIQKNDRFLDSEGEIIIGDGYTTTDEGELDNLLMNMNRYFVSFYSKDFNGRTILDNRYQFGPSYYKDIDTIELKWVGNKFEVDFNSHPDINPDDINPGNSFYFNYLNFKLEGEVVQNSSNIYYFRLNNFRNYFSSQFAWDDILSDFELKDLKVTSISKNKDTLIYIIDEADIEDKVKSFDWKFIDYWDNSTTYTQNKSDLKKIEIVFTK